MGRTIDMIFSAAVQSSKPTWTKDGSAFSMLWQPSQGDLAMRAVAQRVDEVCASLKVSVAEVARVTAPRDRNYEAVYVRTEPL